MLPMGLSCNYRVKTSQKRRSKIPQSGDCGPRLRSPRMYDDAVRRYGCGERQDGWKMRQVPPVPGVPVVPVVRRPGDAAGLDVHPVPDNCATRKHPKVHAWLAKRSRFHRNSAPTSASLLNQVERWFAIISQHAIKRRSSDSVPHLVRTIQRFIADYNETTTPSA